MVGSNPTTTAKGPGYISATVLSIVVKEEMVPLFFQLLAHGFSMNVQTGCSVKELLCRQIGIPEGYLSDRIKTIFLNAKVVDNVNSAIVNDGSTLALSGAMPGLVGAILRSGGYYAAMRSQISHGQNKPTLPPAAGRITLKLMNLVVKELGPSFLDQGIWFSGDKLLEFITHHLGKLTSGIATSEIDSEPIELNKLLELDWDARPVFLQVRAEKEV